MSRPKPSSRENGRLSHGPKTQDGKDRVRFNALRHGLRSERAVVLSTESQEDFDRLLDEHFQRFQPRDQVEADALNDIAAARWRLRRLESIETGLLEKALSQVAGVESANELAEAFTALAGNRVFDLLLRYEGRLQTAFQRGLRTLIQLREKLPAETPAQENAPVAETTPIEEPAEAPMTMTATAASETSNEPIFTVPLRQPPQPQTIEFDASDAAGWPVYANVTEPRLKGAVDARAQTVS